MSERLNLNNPKIKEFVDHVKRECRAAGIKVELRRVSYLKLSHGIRCSGYFDEINKKLVVAVENSLALGVLAHEFGHFTQWKEAIPIWEQAGVALDYVDNWLAGKEVRGIKKWIDLARDLELDNERRTVNIIKQFNLPISIDLYTKRANAYILFYNWLLITRKWSRPGNSPYKNRQIIKACSAKFNMKYKKLSKRIEKVFTEEKI